MTADKLKKLADELRNDKNQAEQYAFIRIPKAMMTEEIFNSWAEYLYTYYFVDGYEPNVRTRWLLGWWGYGTAIRLIIGEIVFTLQSAEKWENVV